MRDVISYEIEKLKPVLKEKGFNFVKLPVSDDWCEGYEDSVGKRHAYYFAIPEVSEVEYIHGLGLTMSIKFKSGEEKTAFGPNYAMDKTRISMNHNDFISPKLNYNGERVEASPDFTQWLSEHGVSSEFLDTITQHTTIYQTIEYPGVPSVVKYDDSDGYEYSYSSVPPVLTELQIKKVLDGIEDEWLRLQIECILNARVFRKEW